MPRLRIRNFSGGLVTNQSEFDLAENQYTAFEKVLNKKPGRLERPKKKKRDLFKEFIKKDEVGIDKPEEVNEYTSFDWYSDYIKLTNKK